MKKTCVFLAGIALVIFIAFACKMPNSIEFKTDNFAMNAPVKIGRFNLATVLSETVRGSFPEGFEIYEMVDYPDALAFLISYPMDDMLKSFNPDDYLKDMKSKMNITPKDIDDIYPQPIIVRKMTTSQVEDKYFFFDMTGFFQDIQEDINRDSTDVTSTVLGHQSGETEVTLTGSDMKDFNNMPSFMVINNNTNDHNFDSVFVSTGSIVLFIWLEFHGVKPAAGEFNVELDNIELKGSEDGVPIGVPPTPATAELTSFHDENHKYGFVVDIAGEEIERDNPPQFSLGSITTTYTGVGSSPGYSYTLYMQPQVKGKPNADPPEDIVLSGARNLKIGVTREPLPEDIIDAMTMEAVDDMLNADIARGKLRIEPETPEWDTSDSRTSTGCKDMLVGYEIYIEQEPVWLNVEGVNTEFKGLKNVKDINPPFAKYNPLDEDPSLGPYQENGQTKYWQISGEELNVNDQTSKIVIQSGPGGTTFDLCNDKIGGNAVYYYDDGAPCYPLDDKVLPIKIDMGIDIYELEVVRWKTERSDGTRILPDIEIPPINFGGSDEKAVIKSITFNKMILDVNFTVPDDPPSQKYPEYDPLKPGSGLPEELKNHIALRIRCPEFGFYENDPRHTKELAQEENEFTGTTPSRLIINDEDPRVNVYADLLPVVDGQMKGAGFPYMEFGSVDMTNNDDVVMNIFAQVNMDYTWSEAEIDMQAVLSDSNRREPYEPVDMSKFSKYMHGITFSDHIEAKIYMSGPSKLIELLQPRMNFWAEWEDENMEIQTESMLTLGEFKVGDHFPKLPGKDFLGELVYSGIVLPEPELGMDLTGSFGRIIASLPPNLRLKHEMVLSDTGKDTLTVRPETFDDVEEGDDSKLKALLMLILPMKFIAEPGGYFAIPGDMFGSDDSGEDLFGRTSINDDSIFTSVNIKSLGMRMDFGYSFFAGSYLRFDRDDILFGENGIFVGKGNSLNITFTSEQKSIINENLIYPSIKFVYPEGRSLQIDKYVLPVRIVIAASGSYTLKLDDDIGLGN